MKLSRKSKLSRWVLYCLGFRENIRDPDPMNYQVATILVAMTAILSAVLVISNLAALKIWRVPILTITQLWPIKCHFLIDIPVDAGILLFPISYIVGDLLVNIYGLKIANLVAVWSALLAVLAVMIFWIAKTFLPDYPGADNTAFLTVQGAAGRIFLASVAGFLASQILNNHVFVLLRNGKMPTHDFKDRAIVSSLIARVLDVVIFEVLAFIGKLSLGEFVRQVVFAYVAGVLIELAVSRFTAFLAKKFDAYLQYNDGHDTTTATVVDRP